MRKRRAWLILSKKSKFIYGAFPRTPEGKSDAKKYLTKISKGKDDKSFIIR